MRLSAATFSVTAAAIISAVAIASCGGSSGNEAASSGADTHMGAMHQAAATQQEESSTAPSQAKANVAPTSIKLIVKSDEEEAVKGADGKYHDAFIPANFTVKAGQKITVTVYNYDDMKHSFTDPGLGVNATIAAGDEKQASKTTFTFTAPTKAGEYEWYCDFPCDPYSMAHKGLMRGDVTVS